MLDKIQNNSSEIINQSQNLDRIKGLGVSNPFEENEKNFFIDESNISNIAMKKYQREIDVKHFSEILLNTSQQEADNLVIQEVLNGQYSIDDNNFLSELLDNEEFLNDIK